MASSDAPAEGQFSAPCAARHTSALPPRPPSPSAKQRPVVPSAAPTAREALPQIRIASPVCAPRAHAHSGKHAHAHAHSHAAVLGEPQTACRLDFSSPPEKDKAACVSAAQPAVESPASLESTVLGFFSPRPGCPAALAVASPEVVLAVAQSEKATLQVLLQARCETAEALLALRAERATSAAANTDAQLAASRAQAAERVAADARRSISDAATAHALALQELHACREEVRAAHEQSAACRAALLRQEVAAEEALFRCDELAAGAAEATRVATQLRGTLCALLAAVGVEPPARAAKGASPLVDACAFAAALARPVSRAAEHLAAMRDGGGAPSPAGDVPVAAAAAAALGAKLPGLRVLARVRPSLGAPWATVHADGATVQLGQGALRRCFAADCALGPQATQEHVYAQVQPLVLAALRGHSCCVLAFGQTASGKTHTMVGGASPDTAGVLARCLAQLFAARPCGAALGVTMLEVYNEQVRDLLAEAGPGGSGERESCAAFGSAIGTPARRGRPSLPIRHAGGAGRCVGASELKALSSEEAHAALARGVQARRSSVTAANAVSSRSHLLIGLSLGPQAGRLWLVDLAGSERSGAAAPPPLASCASAPCVSTALSAAADARSREGAHINRSLCALIDCVDALAKRAPHVPWRNSKLTELLADCLSSPRPGAASALLIAHVSPCAGDSAESAHTLAFAERARGCALRLPPAAKAAAETKAALASAQMWKGAATQAKAERDAANMAASSAKGAAAAAQARATLADAAASAARREAACARAGVPMEAAEVQAILATPFTARGRRSLAPEQPRLMAERSAPCISYSQEDELPPVTPAHDAGPRSAVKARRPLSTAPNGTERAASTTPFKARLLAAMVQEPPPTTAASTPGRTPGRGLAMLAGAARIQMKPGSRAAAMMAAASEHEKPAATWSSRW